MFVCYGYERNSGKCSFVMDMKGTVANVGLLRI